MGTVDDRNGAKLLGLTRLQEFMGTVHLSVFRKGSDVGDSCIILFSAYYA
jgi:hypothetical protein